MKNSILVLIMTSVIPTVLLASGSSVRGGGDPCEERIQIIASDLTNWISDGGAAMLELPQNMSKEVYSKRMISQIRKAKVSCVDEGDIGYPVQIDNVPKVCRFDLSNKKSLIICNLKKFLSLNEVNQYELIHHEYAGLARIEIPKNSISDYTISNQIPAYLLDHNRKGLSVLPRYSAELIVPPEMSLPIEVRLVLRHFLHNYCYFSMSSIDAVLEKIELKSVINDKAIGYTDNVRQIKVNLNLFFGSDDSIFEELQTVELDNKSGSYQIKDAIGVCDKVLRYN